MKILVVEDEPVLLRQLTRRVHEALPEAEIVAFDNADDALAALPSGAIELASVLKHPEETVFTGRAYDETFSRIMRKMWVQFAKTGNPSLSEDISPDGRAYEWPLYDTDNRQVMVFDEFNIHPEKESDLKVVDWDNIYPLTKYFYL